MSKVMLNLNSIFPALSTSFNQDGSIALNRIQKNLNF